MHAVNSRNRRQKLGACLLGLCAFCATLPLWAESVAVGSPTQPLDVFSDVIHRHGLWVGSLLVFLAGFALNFTPCIYPMIPVTLAFFTSQATGKLFRSILLASCYVLGIALNYALLGVLAAQTGALFGSWLQSPTVLIGVATVVVCLALSMFGLYELRVPAALAQRFGHASTGLWGAFLMGLVVGLVAAPCIGPFVLSLLLIVGQLASPAIGFWLFFLLGLGMGLPYVVLGVVANRMSRLPKAGVWLVWSKKVLGMILLGLALYFIRPLLTSGALRFLTTVLLLGAGVYLGWLDRTEARQRWFQWSRWVIGSGLIVSAVGMAWPKQPADHATMWMPYSQAAFEQAQNDERPMVIDIYADWCLPCVEMDHVTFRHAEVMQALASVATLRLDVTSRVSSDGETLLERYHIYGVPTVLFFDQHGKEREDLRLTGFVGSEDFLRLLSQLQSGTGRENPWSSDARVE